MRGRGAYWSGASKDFNSREFDSIGSLGNKKVLKVREGVENLVLPQYSNTPNTTYYSVNNSGEIKSIGFYRDHKIVKSIDITSKGAHYHIWKDSTVTRKGVTTPSRLKVKVEYPLFSDRDKRLVKQAQGRRY